MLYICFICVYRGPYVYNICFNAPQIIKQNMRCMVYKMDETLNVFTGQNYLTQRGKLQHIKEYGFGVNI